jgi:hypothetical protein
MKKLCKWCDTKRAVEDFYKHPMMASGRLNKCRFCCTTSQRKNYRDKWGEKQEYEKIRGQTPHRKRKVLEYQRTRRSKYPEKDKARRTVAYYVRTGKLIKAPCRICGDRKSEAHHADYSKPLEVDWLCHFHHRQLEGRTI